MLSQPPDVLEEVAILNVLQELALGQGVVLTTVLLARTHGACGRRDRRAQERKQRLRATDQGALAGA